VIERDITVFYEKFESKNVRLTFNVGTCNCVPQDRDALVRKALLAQDTSNDDDDEE
jgi:hypothetical protein